MKENSIVARYEARLVVQGISQVEREDFFKTGALIAATSTLRIVLYTSDEGRVQRILNLRCTRRNSFKDSKAFDEVNQRFNDLSLGRSGKDRVQRFQNL